MTAKHVQVTMARFATVAAAALMMWQGRRMLLVGNLRLASLQKAMAHAAAMRSTSMEATMKVEAPAWMEFAQLVPKRMMEVALLALLGPSRQKVALAGFAFQEHFPTQEKASV